MNSEMDNLHAKLKETEQKLYLSAKHGKDLLEENVKLKEMLKSERNRNTTSSEGLEQERYSLRTKLDASKKTEEALKEELEFNREQTTKDKREKEKIWMENTKLTQRIKELESELTEGEENEAELRAVIERHESKITELVMETDNKTSLNKSSTYSEGMINDLQKENDELKERQITLMRLIDENETKLEEAQKVAKTEQHKVEMLETELETKECQLTSYGNTLERCREENSDLQAEIQILTMQEVDPNRRGNSLFSEVEDNRQRLEKQLNSLKIKYNDLLKENQENLKRISTLQLKLAASAATIGSGAITAHVDYLERQVAKLQAEQRVLVAKRETQVKIIDFSSVQKDEDVTSEYLKAMINQAQSHSQEVETRYKTLQLTCMNESESNRKVRRQLFETNQKADALRSENVLLKLKLEELQQKCGHDVNVKKADPIEEKKTNLSESVKVDVKKEKVTENEERPTSRVRFSSIANRNVPATSETDSVIELQSKKRSETLKPLKMVTVTNDLHNECKQQ